jgi:2-polyprenyl-3-methyl-5-hydroxy-6-metoxy-1,4-benzoquinol methylase
MDFYASFGHGQLGTGKEVPCLETVLAQEKSDPNSTIDAKRLIKTIKALEKSELSRRFLDVGCGYGFFSKEAMDVGYDVISLELAQNERNIAQSMTEVTPVATSFENFTSESGSFGVVFMSQILEHALDVNLWIKKAHDLLVTGGVLAIALPNFGSIFRIIMQEKDPFLCPPAHLNFFNPQSLSRLLEKHGFKVEAIQWVSRIPKRTFEKRLPTFCKPLLPAINFSSSLSLKVIDALHFGTMINVYARKKGD